MFSRCRTPAIDAVLRQTGRQQGPVGRNLKMADGFPTLGPVSLVHREPWLTVFPEDENGDLLRVAGRGIQRQGREGEEETTRPVHWLALQEASAWT